MISLSSLTAASKKLVVNVPSTTALATFKGLLHKKLAILDNLVSLELQGKILTNDELCLHELDFKPYCHVTAFEERSL